MNKKKLILLTSLVAVVVTAFVLSLSTVGVAKVDNAKGLKLRLKKPDVTDLVFVAVNNWNYVMRNNGSYMYDSPDADENANNAGGEFPRGSGITIVYAGGLYIGTIKNGEAVVSETEFATEYQPGAITNSDVPFEELVADNPLSATNQVYQVDRSGSGDDYNNWPAMAPVTDLGLPAVIADGQTWAVFNDLDITLNAESELESPFPGLGMEVIIESFAFNAGPLSDVVYVKLTITNKTNTRYPNSYLGAWMDADVNDSSNDIVGVDTARGLGYVYNEADEGPGADFATGFDFFQGPVVDKDSVSPTLASKFAGNTIVLVYDPAKNIYVPTTLPANEIWLGATAFNTYANGTDPVDNNERYNLLAGRDKSSGIPKTGCGINDYYAFRGNPLDFPNGGSCDVAGVGSLSTDAVGTDQRILHGVGPFTIEAGASQEIWLGIVGAGGTSRLNAVSNMFATDDLAQITFSAGLVAPKPPSVPKMEVTALNGAVSITWSNNAEVEGDDAGEILGITTADGYSANYVKYDFQGYRVWKSLTGLPGTFTQLAEFDKADGLTSVVNRTLNSLGNVDIEEIIVGTDNGLRYSLVDRDVTNMTRYYYSVTAYDAQPYISTSDYVTLKDDQTTRYAQGAALGLSNVAGMISPTGSATAYLDSITVLSDTTLRSGGVAGIKGDTITIGTGTYNEVSFVVLDVVHVGDWGPHLPAVGQLSSTTRTLTFTNTYNANYTEASAIHTVDVTLKTTMQQTLPTTIRKPSGLPITLQTSQTSNVTSVVPMAPIIGTAHDADLVRDTEGEVAVAHTGPSDGSLGITIVDPTKVQDGTYKLDFFTVPADSQTFPLVGAAYLPSNKLVYQILLNNTVKSIDTRVDDPRTFYDVNANGTFENGVDIKLDDSKFGVAQASAADEATQVPIVVDGIRIVVYGPALDMKRFLCVANGTGPLAIPDMGTFAFNANGFPTLDGAEAGHAVTFVTADDGLNDRPNIPNLLAVPGAASVANGGKWGVHTGSTTAVPSEFDATYANFLVRVMRGTNFTRFVPYDFEMRFTAGGSLGWWAFGDNSVNPIPFELWRVGIGTYADTTDDVQMVAGVLDDVSATNVYDMGQWDHSVSGGDNDPYMDWVYWYIPTDQTPGRSGWNSFFFGTGSATEVMARTTLVNFNAGQNYTDVTWPATVNQVMPATGTIFRIISTKPNQETDEFTFTATDNTVTATSDLTKKSLKNVKVVPNPYYGRSTYQASLFDKQVKFTNLPATCKIKIFTVAGDLVATLDHNDMSNNNRLNTNPLDLFGQPAAQTTSTEIWNLQNSGGKYVASGMYIALIDAPGIGKKLVKFAVIQEEIQINGPDNR